VENADRIVRHQAGLSQSDEDDMSIDPELIRAQADQVQRIAVSEARAAEIAVELDALIAGVALITSSVGLFDDPDGLRAVLWELREGAPR
jgi:hypothetical protein